MTERSEVGKYPKCFKGEYDSIPIYVTIVRIGPKEAEKVLVQVKGYDHDLDGYIAQCNTKWLVKDKSYYYTTSEYPGIETWNVFYNEAGGWGGDIQKIFPPGIKTAVPVYSCECHDGAEFILTKYLEQNDK